MGMTGRVATVAAELVRNAPLLVPFRRVNKGYESLREVVFIATRLHGGLHPKIGTMPQAARYGI